MKRFFQGPIVFAAALLFTASGFALPKGGKCIKGSAKTHSSKKGLEITTDHNTWMDWDSFSIGKGEKVAFKMPNAKSCTINRVQGKTPSDIQGRLEANGSVYLLNRNGILIGKEAVINAASFLASTLDLVSDEVFAKDELLFRLGKEKGIITNYGMIETTAGSVTLLGYHVSNHGTVKAGSGKVFLGGGEEILLRPDEGILIRPSLEDLDTGVDNQGTIEALEVYL
ncbi:MAG: filamentous hemagglutinin N-terminal domain-containing protein, partial [Chlamydiia bacterium]|nr:filamentous hemagglutinin N-terminal domain-containing protein [Chlamydiia bacterium]